MTTRTRIVELVSRHALEPSLREVVVEGVFDQRVVQKFVKSIGPARISVLQIANIEIPDAVQSSEERGSNRGRILALMRELASAGREHVHLYSIIDRDYDDLGVSHESVPGVRRTDYSTMDMYFFDPDLLGSVVEDFLNITLDDYQAVLDNFLDIMSKISLLYAANVSLGLNYRILPLRRCCTYDRASGLLLDLEDYADRYFNTAVTHCTRDQFEAEVASLKLKSPVDARTWVRGKNYWELLEYVLRQHGAPRNLCTVDNLQSAFVLALDGSRYQEWALFEELAIWAGNAAP